ncbi:MAG: glycerophosphodiester phosphodiesterase [Planctomycetia bacterium]|nr:glycerophosphodiester phosphodiesterase [Planctomycetia bacterium]
MLILSHRGYHVELPENTLAAFRAAIEMGVDGIETDIRLTADGVPILFHDHLAPDGRDVAAVRHTDLSALVGFTIPTVDEALELPVPNPAEFLWNLEVKTPAAIEQTIAIVNRHCDRRKLLVTSFCHPAIDEISRRVDVECGLIVCFRPVAMQIRPDWVPSHPRVSSIVWCWEFGDARLIEHSAACGLKNYVYGVTSPDEHARAATWGLDGVITDRPEYLLAADER